MQKNERQKDGLFYCRNDKPFVFSWGKSRYRLEPVTEIPGIFVVPAPPNRVFEKKDFPPALLVVGERGGGLTHFVGWICGGRPATDRSDTKQDAGKWQSMDLETVHQALCVEGRHKRVPMRIILDRSSTSSEASERNNARLAEIAAVLESSGWRASSNHIICATRDVHKLQEDLVYSSILRRGVTCRLPHFSGDELVQWMVELGKKYKVDSDNLALADEVKRWVGGQPTLTHNFFRLIDDQLQRKVVPDLNEVVAFAGAYLQKHRPHIVDHWARDLHGLLRMPPLRRRLATYTAGEGKHHERDEFDDEDARLFLAGWVGLNPEGIWGIRSRCHERWAREILRGEL